LTRPKDYKKHYQDFLNKAGFKNGKEHHKNALHLTISQGQALKPIEILKMKIRIKVELILLLKLLLILSCS